MSSPVRLMARILVNTSGITDRRL